MIASGAKRNYDLMWKLPSPCSCGNLHTCQNRHLPTLVEQYTIFLPVTLFIKFTLLVKNFFISNNNSSFIFSIELFGCLLHQQHTILRQCCYIIWMCECCYNVAQQTCRNIVTAWIQCSEINLQYCNGKGERGVNHLNSI